MWYALVAVLFGARVAAAQIPPAEVAAVAIQPQASFKISYGGCRGAGVSACARVQADRSYCIRGWAVDTMGMLLGEASITLYTSALGIPEPPDSLETATVSDGSISYRWRDSSINEIGFNLYCDPGTGQPMTRRGTAAAQQTSCDVTGLMPNIQYSAQVAAVGAFGESDRSAQLTVRTLATTPVYGTAGDGSISCGNGPPDPRRRCVPGTQFAFTATNGFGDGGARAGYYAYTWNQDSEPPPNRDAVEYWSSGELALTATQEGACYLHLWACNFDGGVNERCATIGPYVIRETCRHAKTVPAEAAVRLSGEVVSGVFPDSIYLQEQDRSSGIRAMGSFDVRPGDVVSIAGTTRLQSKELVLKDIQILDMAPGDEPAALLVSNKALGGGAIGDQPAAVDCVGPRRKEAAGLSCAGLLVKTTGKVTHVDEPGEAFAYIDDGSSLLDGSGCRGLRIALEHGPIPALGADAEVTGCGGTTDVGGNCARYLRPRSAADICCSRVQSYLRNRGFETGAVQPWVCSGYQGQVRAQAPFANIPPHSGSRLFSVFGRDPTYSGTLIQGVDVPAGTYRASVWSRVFHMYNSPDASANRVGIDPTGGVDPSSPNVRWSAWDKQSKPALSEWRLISTPAVIMDMRRCTVFLQYSQRFPSYRLNCFDEVELIGD